MTALVSLWTRSPEEPFLNQLTRQRFTFTSQSFGREPNALPKLSNLLRTKILAPRARFELATLRLTAT